MTTETEQDIANLIKQRTYLQRQARWLLDRAFKIETTISALEAKADDEAVQQN